MYLFKKAYQMNVLLVSVFIQISILILVSNSVIAETHYKFSPDQEHYLTFDKAPAFIDSIPPTYPLMALKAHLEGVVVIRVFIEETGTLGSLEILKKQNPLLMKSAQDAALESSYTPAFLAGQPVPGWLLVSYDFNKENWILENIISVRPPIDWTSPLVSDVGQLVKTKQVKGITRSTYKYDNIKFIGDLSMSMFGKVIDQIAPFLEEGEVILTVNHYLSYKEFGIIDYSGKSDLTVITSTVKNPDTDCVIGKIYKFKNQDKCYILQQKEGEQTFLMR